jgi:hypothetical protein
MESTRKPKLDAHAVYTLGAAAALAAGVVAPGPASGGAASGGAVAGAAGGAVAGAAGGAVAGGAASGGAGGGGGGSDPIEARFSAYVRAVASQVKLHPSHVTVSLLHGLQRRLGAEGLFGEDLAVAVEVSALMRAGRSEELRALVRSNLSGSSVREALYVRYAMAALVGQPSALPSLSIARRVWDKFQESESSAFKLAQTFSCSSSTTFGSAPAVREVDLNLIMTPEELRARFARARAVEKSLRYWDRAFEILGVVPDGIADLPTDWVDEENGATRTEIRAGKPWLPWLRPDGSVASVFRDT